MKPEIYLDFNATTPVTPDVASVMSVFLRDSCGNPSSFHRAGHVARDAVEKARSQMAALLGCDATEVAFTSGGTEACNLAIKGLFFASSRRDRPFHVITSRIEHPAVLEPCRFIETLGAEVTRLPVDRFGRVDPDDVRRAIRPHTVLVSIMHASNEVGTIQPLQDIATIVREHDILMHTDAAQTVGRIAVDVDAAGVDLLTVAGHKLHAPKGVGALYVREGIDLEPLLHGAGQEAGRRAGTENVAGIAGLGAACVSARPWIDSPDLRAMRDCFWQLLRSRFGDRVILNGHPELRLPNTLNVSFRGQHGQELLARLPHIAASTGSACHGGSAHFSPVLTAMNLPEDIRRGAIRFSLGRTTTAAEIESVTDDLEAIVLR